MKTITSLFVVAALALTSASNAQTFPTKPVTMIIPFPAGGRTDVIGRIFAQSLKDALGKPIVVAEPEVVAPEPEPPAVVAVAPSAEAATPAAGPPSSGVGTTPGPGAGSQRGSGSDGDGIYPIGNGVTAPIPLRRPPPAYTAEAMRARLQGIVVLNCVVRQDGRCSDIRITKSLDMMFGLDEQAIASAREWRFRPGTRMGEPVPVLVTLEIGFTIR